MSDSTGYTHQHVRTAQEIMAELNGFSSRDSVSYRKQLEELLGSVGDNVKINFPFYCCIGKLIFIDDFTLINSHCHFMDGGKIFIGRHTMIGPGVQIYTTHHPRIETKDESEIHYGMEYRPVKIGNGCWVGGCAILLPGVEIGDGTTIGAGSVVTKSIPARYVAAGNPCRLINPVN
ncbi:MAG: sugar O-acetyltransferase [Planctomycetaceae bacterium]|jgi:maltose O-acetyltransferase|nr:sugar O-acetyltransferase [Planctomycetaceae bacterium]